MINKNTDRQVFGTCAKCGETHFPLSYYPRTKEWLCAESLREREREYIALQKVKALEKEDKFWVEVMTPIKE